MDKVLLVDDDRAVREALAQSLELADLVPITAGSFVEAKDHISARFDGVVLTDIRMPGRDGFHLLDHVRRIDPELPVLLLTGEGDVPMALRAMEAGAFRFLEKPCAPRDLVTALRAALELRWSVLEGRANKEKADAGDAAARMIFGVSPQIQALRQRVRRVAQTRAEILISGEAGSGTPKIAEVIHLLSPHAHQPFVKNAANGLDANGLDRAFDEAGVGTLYIDEIGALERGTQFALLDRLEAGAQARVVAGSTTELSDLVTTGSFASDLFFRLDLMRVRVPSIRERTEDIPVLFEKYVSQASEQANLPRPDITPEVLASLMAQEWPGNARALMNSAMRFVLDLSEQRGEADPDGLGLAEQMAQVEKSLLIAALKRFKGQAGRTATSLKLPRKTFYDKLARHGLKTEDFRLSDARDD